MGRIAPPLPAADMCPVVQGPQMRQHEMNEIIEIYEKRGLPRNLAEQVAWHFTHHDGTIRPPRSCTCSAREVNLPVDVKSI